MKRLVRLVIYLYPAAWRKRYGHEFDALLEDVNPRGTDSLNVLGGALKMQLTQGSFWKISLGCALVGALLAGIWGWFTIPDKHRAIGVLSMPAAASPRESSMRVEELVQEMFSRTVLAELMMRENLYTADRSREPLEDVIERMRTKDIRARVLPSRAIAIEFDYPDASKASSTVKSLMIKMVEVVWNSKQAGAMQSKGGLKIVSLSEKLVAPNRLRIACFGLVWDCSRE